MIKFVYFDLGGVVESDFSGTNKWSKMKKIMGVNKKFEKEFDKLYNEYELKDLCLNHDVDTLIPIFTEKFNMKFPKNFSMLTYFVDHFKKNVSIWPVIEEINQTCRIGLLTNMYPRMFKEIEKRNLLPPVNWDVVIDSSVVGLQKPDSQIFDLAQKRSQVNCNEILFIDNTKANVDAASDLGWFTFFYNSAYPEDSSKRISDFFETLN